MHWQKVDHSTTAWYCSDVENNNRVTFNLSLSWFIQLWKSNRHYHQRKERLLFYSTPMFVTNEEKCYPAVPGDWGPWATRFEQHPSITEYFQWRWYLLVHPAMATRNCMTCSACFAAASESVVEDNSGVSSWRNQATREGGREAKTAWEPVHKRDTVCCLTLNPLRSHEEHYMSTIHDSHSDTSHRADGH